MAVGLFDVMAQTALSIREIVIMHIGISCIILSGVNEAVFFFAGAVHCEESLFESGTEEYHNRQKIRMYVL
jgi:hypothetical protein